jgi:polar amino acid transport system substrate-binding protein
LGINRIDLFIDSLDSVNFYLNNELKGLKNTVEPVYPHIENDKIYMVFSKKRSNYKKLMSDFDKGIQLLKKEGRYSKILKKHGMSDLN